MGDFVGFFTNLFSKPYNSIDAKSVIEKKSGGWKPIIIDVRTDQEIRQTGVISGCNFKKPHNVIEKVRKNLSNSSDVLVYCRSGARSSLACSKLVKLGIDGSKIYNLKGGIMAWQRFGGKISKP